MNVFPVTQGTPLIYQPFQKGHNSYRYMATPPQRQQLQLLYPGRLMNQDYSFTGDNIPNEFPEAAIKTRQNQITQSNAAQRELLAMKKYLGGYARLYAHPWVEPEVLVEDPGLGYNSMSVVPPITSTQPLENK